jgi:threonine/homoserine/homoserine lactone efflux protein
MFLLKGILLGISIAAPVGPIGLLCIRRTLAQGKLSGFVSGLGAATADALYGVVAAFGLTAISTLLFDYQYSIKLIGGLFLFYLAVTTFFAKPQTRTSETGQSVSLFKSYASTLFLTITNPVTIISFVALFAGLGIVASNGDYASASLLVVGVFLGSAIWWLSLSLFVGIFKNKFSAKGMIWVNRFSGILMVGLGLMSFLK